MYGNSDLRRLSYSKQDFDDWELGNVLAGFLRVHLPKEMQPSSLLLQKVLAECVSRPKTCERCNLHGSVYVKPDIGSYETFFLISQEYAFRNERGRQVSFCE